MKITAKQFALSLYEATDEKSAAQVKAAVKKFVSLLTASGKLNLADKIIAEFARVWNERNGIVEAEVKSAKNLDKETLKMLKKYIAETVGAEEVTIKEAVDKSLLGGVVIKYGDKILDGSLKAQLEELKNNLIK